MHIVYRRATTQDARDCIRIRGLTRDNAIPEQRLAELGITTASWAEGIRSEEVMGYVCLAGNHMVGYGFGSVTSGEVLVVALLPSHENQGIGRELLRLVTARLRASGHKRLFLGCSPDSTVRSYGFYRRLGWLSTGTFDSNGDEVLELVEP